MKLKTSINEIPRKLLLQAGLRNLYTKLTSLTKCVLKKPYVENHFTLYYYININQ